MTRFYGKYALAAWILDDTGFPKKGTHSVEVARQYCGQLGKQENCRVAVSVSLAPEQASIPASFQLYLPLDMGQRCQPAPAGWRSPGDPLSDQAEDGAATDLIAGQRGGAARRGAR